MNHRIAFVFLGLLCVAEAMTFDVATGLAAGWMQGEFIQHRAEGLGVSADGLGGVYMAGYTEAEFSSQSEAFLSKYSASGVHLWTEWHATPEGEINTDVSADRLGGVYTAGRTGWPSLNAYIRKYDAGGNVLWTSVLGTEGSVEAAGVAADGLGGVYVTGRTYGNLDGPNAGGADAFLSSYDTAGILQWTRQLGTALNDGSNGVSIDGLGGVYISGSTEGSLAGPTAGNSDAFLAKYDAQGQRQWMRQLGTPEGDGSAGVAADGLGGVYMAGSTSGVLDDDHAGLGDAFVSKYDPQGVLQWTRQLAAARHDGVSGLATDGLGNVYLNSNGFTVQYNALGSPTPIAELNGFPPYLGSTSISVDAAGAYITGSAIESKAPGAGYYAYLIKYQIAEPASICLALATVGLSLVWSATRRAKSLFREGWTSCGPRSH